MTQERPAWDTLEIRGPVDHIRKIAQGLRTATDAVTLALDIQQTALNILAALTTNVINAEAYTMKAAISSLQALLDSFFQNEPKIHILAVPIRKQPVFRYSDYIIGPQEEDSWSINELIPEKDRQTFQKTLDEMFRIDEGNLGFARTVIESIYDEGDNNRPLYDTDCAIYAQVYLAGAENFVGIYSLLRFLQGIFSTSLRGNPLIPYTAEKSATNLQATTIATGLTPKIAIHLSWDNAPTEQVLTDLDGSFMRLQEIAIIRSLDPQVITAKTWSDIFGANQLAALSNDTPEKKDIQIGYNEMSHVVVQRLYDGVTNEYIDDTEELEAGTDYYYTVAYRYAIAPNDPTVHERTYFLQDYQSISNVIKIRYDQATMPRKPSIQPDWLAWPSVLDNFPALKHAILLLQHHLEIWKNQITSGAAALTSYIDFLQAEIDRFNAYARALNDLVNQLAGLLQVPSTGIYITTISQETGGMTYFMTELIRRLSDVNDPSTPPFHPTGLTAGVVVLAGATNPAQLAPVRELLSLLFGPPLVANAYEGAVASTNSLIASSKRAINDLTSTRATSDRSIAYRTFNSEMEPVPADDPTANVPFDP